MLKIRPATRKDAALIVELVRALAAYERAPEAAVLTRADVLRDGFGRKPRFHAVIAEWDSKPVGFALWFYNYSTWQGRAGVYLEDLFVYPEFRGRGIGEALLVHLARIALKQKCGRYVWQVLDWNIPSIEFYESLGAKIMKEWLTMRVEGEALRRLADLA
jgi:GNAT superfamily N-acetyltransferase